MRVPPSPMSTIPPELSAPKHEDVTEKAPQAQVPHRDAFEIDRETYPPFYKNPVLSASQEISYSDESGLSYASEPEAELISFSSSDEN